MSALAGNTLEYTHPKNDAAHHIYIRAMTCFVISGFSGHYDAKCASESGGAIDTSRVPEAASESLRDALIENTKFFDLPRVRNWWNTWSYPLRDYRHDGALITNNLHGFDEQTSYKNWPRDIIVKSLAKQKTRVIYRSPDNFRRAISVAETYDSRSGDLNAPIIETEIAVERADHSGNADFYSYNADGQLSTTSKFPAGERPVPGVCLGCHYNPDKGLFTRQAEL